MNFYLKSKSLFQREGFIGYIKYAASLLREWFLRKNPFVTFPVLRIIISLDKLRSPKILYQLIGIKRDQAVTERMHQLKILLVNNLSEGAKIMEIGSWFGEGSTRVILENAPRNSTVFIIDSWTPYTSVSDRGSRFDWLFNFYKTMDDLTFSAFHNISRVILDYEKM